MMTRGVLFCIAFLVGMTAHVAGQTTCQPNTPQAEPLVPKCLDQVSTCIMTKTLNPYSGIAFDAWPEGSASPVSTTEYPISQGIPFQVLAHDVDQIIHKCMQGGTSIELITVADLIEYKYTITQGGLPSKGFFAGLGEPNSDNWKHPAAIYYFEPGIAPGIYSFAVSCLMVNRGLSAGRCGTGDPEQWVDWAISVEITDNCTLKILSIMSVRSSPGVVTVTDQTTPCCDAGKQWHRVDVIAPDYISPYRGPDIVEKGTYAVFSGHHKDTDKLERCCDDNSGEGCVVKGDSRILEDCRDSLEYTFSAKRNYGPGGAGTFPEPVGDYAAIWQAPTEAGYIDICLEVTNRMIGTEDVQIGDPKRISPPFSFRVLVVDSLKGQEPQASTYLVGNELECKGLTLWVNDDDDNQDALPDTQSVANMQEEDDMALIELPDLGDAQVRINVLSGADKVKLWNRKDRTGTDAAIPLGAWKSASFFTESATDPRDTIWVEGLAVSSDIFDVVVAIDYLRTQPSPGSDFGLRKIVKLTVQGIKTMAWSTTADAVTGHAQKWSSVTSPDARPDNFRGALADKVYFIEPGARIGQDVLDGANRWKTNRRNEVKVTLTVVPAAAGVPVYIRPFDVDDNTLPKDWNNFVDDVPISHPKSYDNYGRLSDQNGSTTKTWHGLLRRETGQGLEKSLQMATDQAGEVSFYFASTLAPGNNSRVMASLSKSVMGFDTSPIGDAKVFAPVPKDTVVTEKDYESSFLAYEKTDLPGYRPVADDVTPALAAASQSRSTPVLTVRRVLYIEEDRPLGILDTMVAFGVGLESGEDFMLGIRRDVTEISNKPALGLDREVITGTGRNELRRYHWDQASQNPIVPAGGRRDDSLGYGGRGNLPPGPATPGGPFENGRMKIIGETPVFSISKSGQISCYLKAVGNTPPSFPFKVLDAGNTNIHAGLFTLMEPGLPIPGLPGQTGTKITVTAAVPGTVVDQKFVVGEANAVIKKVTDNSTVLWLQNQSFSFPAMFYGDDQAFALPNGYPSSILDATGNRGNKSFLLVDHYLRNLPVRVSRLPWPYSQADPFAYVHGPVHDDVYFDVFRTKSKVIIGDNIYPEERAWVMHLLSFPESYFTFLNKKGKTVESDGDPDPQPFTDLPFNLQLDNFAATSGYKQLVGQGFYDNYVYTVLFPESTIENHRAFSGGLAWTLPYPGWQASRFDVLRARMCAHELVHSLSESVPLDPRWPGPNPKYPPEMRNEGFHGIPGISRPTGSEIADPVASPGASPGPRVPMQCGANLNPVGTGLVESDLSPYLVWWVRSRVKAPRLFR